MSRITKREDKDNSNRTVQKNRRFTGNILFFLIPCSVSCCSYFAKCIPKLLRYRFLKGVELLLFVSRIASEQYGRDAYPQQKSFLNGIYPQNVNMNI